MTGEIGVEWTGEERTGLVKHGLVKHGLITTANLVVKQRLFLRILVTRGLVKPRNCKTWTSKYCELIK